MISDALWNEIARALQACYPERAPAMLRELEKDRNVALLHIGGSPCELIIAGMDRSRSTLRGLFYVTALELSDGFAVDVPHGLTVQAELQSTGPIVRTAE